MKRFLLFLILCGSLAAQEPDPYQLLLDERATLEARMEETHQQSKFHRRKALYYQGRIIDGYDWLDEMRYHESKELFFRALSQELYCELIVLNSDLPVELRRHSY